MSRWSATARETLLAVAGLVVLALALSMLWAARDSGPLYGASFQRETGEDYAAALARTDDDLGLDLVRVYYDGAPEPWPGRAPDRSVVVSFKIPPREVLSGSRDAEMRAWFAAAPTDREVYWVYWHEPEDEVDDGLFTASQYRRAFAHLDGLADEADNPRLRSTAVLQSYTTREASGRDWRDFAPEPGTVDVLAWDVYNRAAVDGAYTSPAELLDDARRASESIGSGFAIAEVGSAVAEGDDGTGRSAWLRALGDYAAEHDAQFVAYFDFSWNGGRDDYRLRDAPSVQAWRELVDGG